MKDDLVKRGTRTIFKYRGNTIEIAEFKDSYHEELRLSGLTWYLYASNEDNEDKDLKEIEEKFEIGGFHGGITYCRRITEQSFTNPDPEKRWQQDVSYLKIGCDYAHLYDGMSGHDFESVLYDAKKVVDRLIEHGVIKC